MANLQKSVSATEASNDALNAIVSKALGYPVIGVNIGNGPHVAMPPTWNGSGQCPPGWTKQAIANYVASPASAALPIPDTLATQLQAGPAQARLTGPEQATLAAAIAGRSLVDLDVGGLLPKASAAAKVALEADVKDP